MSPVAWLCRRHRLHGLRRDKLQCRLFQCSFVNPDPLFDVLLFILKYGRLDHQSKQKARNKMLTMSVMFCTLRFIETV
jgi:hypothetical protein